MYGETGRVPLYINLAISSINYWLKLLKKPDSCLSKQAYLMMVKNCEQGKENWVTKIKSILCGHGFGIVWLFKGVTTEANFLKEIKSRLIDVFLQTWNTKMITNDNYKFYFSYKSFFTPEYYLKRACRWTRFSRLIPSSQSRLVI